MDATARITGKHSTLKLTIEEPAGATFTATSLAEECRINERDGVLTRLAVSTADRRDTISLEHADG